MSTGTTPKVQYAYTEMAGGANHSRAVSMTYPNGRVLNYNYAAGLDDRISRLTSLSDNSATLESYLYLRLDTVVGRFHPPTGVDLTDIKLVGEANGDAGDPLSAAPTRTPSPSLRKADREHPVDQLPPGANQGESLRGARENAAASASPPPPRVL